jgi:hypothetical protein
MQSAAVKTSENHQHSKPDNAESETQPVREAVSNFFVKGT